MKAEIKRNNQLFSQNIRLADGTWDRLVGLMFKKNLEGGDGLLLDPCNSIHTCFMRYPLDVVFIDSKDTIVKIIRNIPPWRMTWIYFKANRTLEVPAGKLPKDWKEGDRLEVTYV